MENHEIAVSEMPGHSHNAPANDGGKANPTAAEVAAWKAEHGKLKVVTVDGKDIYFKQPSRTLVAAANQLLIKKGVSAYADSILKNCQLNFIQETKEDDEIYFALTAKVDEIITSKTAALKND